MMARDYQYETSPRKLEPEYEITRKKKNSAKKHIDKNKTTPVKKQTKKDKVAEVRKTKVLVTLNCLVVLAVLFAIIFRNSLITQAFAQNQKLKTDISNLQKENDQLEISIQNSVSISDIEQQAKEQLGMQKLTSKQTIYLNLPKKDYVEPSTEEVVIEQKSSFWKVITDFFRNLF